MTFSTARPGLSLGVYRINEIKHFGNSSFVGEIEIHLGKIPKSLRPFPDSAPVSLANPILDPHYSCIDLLDSLARTGFITLYTPRNNCDGFWK